jgi:hypothetical protein
MLTARLVIITLALLLGACGARLAGPPEIVVDRTACSHCGMLVSELTHAAAYQAEGQAARVFDDIGCMVKAMQSETTTPHAVWVQDANGAGWIDSDTAVFVASPEIRTPMHGGILAYADSQMAAQAATRYRTVVTRSLSALMSSNGDGR